MNKPPAKEICQPKSIPDIIFRSSELYRDKIALISGGGGGEWHKLTFIELRNEVVRAVLSLQKLGVKKGEKALIISENRPEWLIVDMALMLLESISVPIHRNMSPEQIGVVVDEAEAKYAFVSDKAALSILGDHIEKIDKIVMFEKQDVTDTKIKCIISHFSDLMAEIKIDDKTMEDWAHRAQQIDKNNIATIVFTSGTTGKPKGACLTHHNVLFMITNHPLIKYMIQEKHLCFSLLPLSHVYGRIAENFVFLFAGGSICYCQNIRNFTNEVRKCRPSVIMGVPRLFEKLYVQLMQSMKPRIRKMVISAMKGNNSITYQLIINIIKRKIQKSFGGNIRYFISGGAKLDPNIIRFFGLCGIMVLEGYGITEAAATVAVNEPVHFKIGTVGRFFNGIDVRIIDGEIVIKGPSVMIGYINPEDMENAFTKDGYFKTGDLGSIDAEGYLTILGRKKDILVLSTGENIAPVVIEQTLLKSPYIYQALVIGDGYKHISAIIVVNIQEIKKLLKSDTVNVLADERVKHLIDAEVLRTTQDLPEIQRIRKFILATQPFTVENNQLSISSKPRRQEILNFYAAEIKALYGK